MTLKPLLPGALAFCLLGAVPAWAETVSATCVAAIHAAVARHRSRSVPADCWRFGPLDIGMGRETVGVALGRPDATRDLAVRYHGRRFALTQAFYIYPRNLHNWLRLAPQRPFRAATLRLTFWKDRVVAMTVSDTAVLDTPPCVPHAAGTVRPLRAADFPYAFHGLALGTPLDQAVRRFGRFAGGNASRGSHNYWPLPLALGGAAKVDEIDIASGMAFAGLGGRGRFRLHLDPRTCFVNGYALTAGP